MRNNSQQTCNPEYPCHSCNTRYSITNRYEEKDQTEKNQKRVKVVPSVSKKVLRPDPNYSHNQLNDKNPDRDVIKSGRNLENVIDKKDSIDESTDDENGNN